MVTKVTPMAQSLDERGSMLVVEAAHIHGKSVMLRRLSAMAISLIEPAVPLALEVQSVLECAFGGEAATTECLQPWMLAAG